MAEQRCCPQGHAWDPADVGEGSAKTTCPVCGATALRDAAPDSTAASGEATALSPGQKPGAEGLALPALAGYTVLGKLGQGGMGVVYRARHEGLKRLVALKFLRDWANAEPDEAARFRREAETLARMQHPHIVQIHDVGTHQGCPYFAMEFVEGGSLADQCGGAPQPPRQVAEWVETLARAVHAVHERGIIHRDLKPANVLRTAAGLLKISDFGLAKHLEGGASQESAGAIKGTPSYMAPEQASGVTRLFSPAVDVYALGAILYELLTGRPPFRAASSWETLVQVMTQEPKPPSQLRPDVPRDLEIICLKCLAKEPRRRYSSAEALADDLRRFLAGEPIRARAAPAWERAWKWVKRRPAAATALALGVVAALVLVVGWLYLSHFRAQVRAGQLVAARRLIDQAERLRPFAGAVSSLVTDNLKEGEKILQELRDSGDESPPVQEAMARLQLAYVNVDLRLNNTPAALGRAREARDLFERLEKTAAEGPQRAQGKRGRARSEKMIGLVLRLQGKLTEANRHLRQALALCRELNPPEADDLPAESLLAGVQDQLGQVLFLQGDDDGGRPALDEALALRRRLAEKDPRNTEWQRDYAESLMSAGFLAGFQKEDGRQALAYFRRALKILENLAARDRSNDDWQRDRADCLAKIADAYKALGAVPKARKFYNAALAITENNAGRYPNDIWWKQLHLGVRFRSAQLLDDWRAQLLDDGPGPLLNDWRGLADKLTKVLQVHQELDGVLAELAKQDPENADWRSMRGLNLMTSGLCHAGLGFLGRAPEQNFAQARRQWDESLAIARRLADLDPTNVSLARRPAIILSGTANLLAAQGKEKEANALSLQASALRLDAARRLAGRFPARLDLRGDVAFAHYQSGSTLWMAGKPKEALGHLGTARSLYEDLHQRQPKNAQWLEGLANASLSLGSVYLALKDGEKAQAAFQQARALREQVSRLRAAEPAGAPAAAQRPQVVDVWRACSQILWSIKLLNLDRRAVALTEALYQRRPSPEHSAQVAEAYLTLARELQSVPVPKNQEEAARVLRRGLTFLRQRQKERALTEPEQRLLREFEAAVKNLPPSTGS